MQSHSKEMIKWWKVSVSSSSGFNVQLSLTNNQKKHYKSIGHTLKPVVTIAGNGLSDNVITEIERALEDHELIKVKLSIVNRTQRKETSQVIAKQTNATIIQEIGKVALIFRTAKRPNPRLSNLLR